MRKNPNQIQAINMQISKKITLINLMAMLLLLAALVIIGFSYYTTIKQGTIKQQVESIKQSYKDVFEAKKEIWTGNALLIANNPTVKKSLLQRDRESLHDVMDKIGEKFKQSTGFHNIKIHVIDSALHSFYKNWAPKDYGENLTSSKGYQWVKNNAEGRCAMEVSPKGLRLKGLYPVFNNGTFIGIVNFEGGLNSVKRKLKPHKVDFLYFMDKKDLKFGKAIEGSPTWQNYILSQKDYEKHFLNYIKQNITQEKAEKPYHIDDNYITLTGRFSNFRGNSTGYYFLGKHVDHAMTQVNETRNMLLVILSVLFGLFMLLLAALLYFTHTLIIRPVNKGVAFAEKIASGNLDAELKINQSDEIGRMAEALQHMSKKLHQIVDSIQKGADNIVQASDQIASGSQQVANGANQQASSTEQVTSSMEQMTASIRQNTENANVTRKISDNAASHMESMYESSKASLNSIDEIAEKILIINDIAEKTDMLAINAAIEASHAGEHGKGFAVVATEIRKLSDSTQKAADEIIERSQNSRKLTRDTAEKMETLLPEVKKTARLIKEIAAAGEEQNSGAEQVNHAMQQLNDIIQQNAASAEEASTSAEELNAQAATLKQTIAFFKLKKHNDTPKSGKKHDLKVDKEELKSLNKGKNETGYNLNTGTDKDPSDDNFVTY